MTATLVLLPGMDGTGDLFSSFISTFDGPVQVVRYPLDVALDYAELTAFVRAALPQDAPCFILGESFSGPIAIALAAAAPANLRGIILCCTFASNPRPALAWLRAFIAFLPARPPLLGLEFALCGRFANPSLRAALAAGLSQVSPQALRARLASVLKVNVLEQLRSVRVPVLYLRATEDRVVPLAAMKAVVANATDVRVREFAAPHFLLQVMPHETARAVKEFMDEAEKRAESGSVL